jgi:hypothetical protein
MLPTDEETRKGDADLESCCVSVDLLRERLESAEGRMTEIDPEVKRRAIEIWERNLIEAEVELQRAIQRARELGIPESRIRRKVAAKGKWA